MDDTRHHRDDCPQETRIKDIEGEIKQTSLSLALMGKDVSYIKNGVDDLKKLISEQYVLKSDFDPIKKIVYGMTGLILTAVVIAVISLVIKHGQ